MCAPSKIENNQQWTKHFFPHFKKFLSTQQQPKKTWKTIHCLTHYMCQRTKKITKNKLNVFFLVCECEFRCCICHAKVKRRDEYVIIISIIIIIVTIVIFAMTRRISSVLYHMHPHTHASATQILALSPLQFHTISFFIW